MVQYLGSQDEKTPQRRKDNPSMPESSQSTVVKREKDSNQAATSTVLLAQSTKGATYLILLQIGSRALTFLVNQLLLRFLSPELLGISTQLDLYSVSVLFFARESLRVALQRQDDATTSVEARDTKTSQNSSQPDIHIQGRKTQEVVNLSYLAVFLGLPLALVLASLYIRSADSSVLETPAIKQSLDLYCFATILELFSEPCFAIGQQQMLYRVRALAETLATFTRCLLTCGTVIWLSKAKDAHGALPFALGQLGYAVVLNLVYLSRLHLLSRDTPYSILIRPIVPSSSLLLWGRFSLPRLNLVFTIYAQSIFKHLLTTGDSFLIAAFTPLQSQGAYTLAANYGGLIARMLFQPIEESSRSLFGRLLHQRISPPWAPEMTEGAEPRQQDRDQMGHAAEYLQKMLRFYLIICMMAVAVGPSISPLLLRLVAGSRWSNSEAPSVLAAYCYYIPLLAVNGILEAFVSAVAMPAELRLQSAWMVAFSAAFVGTGFLVLEVWDQGAQGLVLANAVNMICRITWSWHFVDGYFQRRRIKFKLAAILPSIGTMLCAFGTACFLSRMELVLWEHKWQLVQGIAAAGSCGCVTKQFHLLCSSIDQLPHSPDSTLEAFGKFEIHYFILRLRAIEKIDRAFGSTDYRSAAGLLRFLPSCTASPIAAVVMAAPKPSSQPVAKPVVAGSKEAMASSGSCGSPSTTGPTADCWTTLKMNDFLANWTENSVIANAPMIGTIVCRPTEPWVQCFIRFAYGQRQKTAAPMDCSNPLSTSCRSPANMNLKPSSAEYWYGTLAIYAIFIYIMRLTSAILTTTGQPGVLQAIYTSANTGAGASAAANPIDATIFQLLQQNGFSAQDTTFAAYMKNDPFTGDFAPGTTNPPSDSILYEGMTTALRARVTKIMGSWEVFEGVLGTGDVWVGPVQAQQDFVDQWTKVVPLTAIEVTSTA
ncbi:MAG: hypothetical protein Q9186_004191 [Xanthomendoza sp. 1 TL-2023]